MEPKFYSQNGEDRIVQKLFKGQVNGFYVDVGAYHPIEYSNTCLLYNKGWHGINIDARPNSMNEFNKLRPQDINLEMGISQTKSELTYYMHSAPALNGFMPELSNKYDNIDGFKIVKTVNVFTYPLFEILEKYLPIGQTIDFLNIDVEGLEQEVLNSNNWDKYISRIIAIELIKSDIIEFHREATIEYLKKLKYEMLIDISGTFFFKHQTCNLHLD